MRINRICSTTLLLFILLTVTTACGDKAELQKKPFGIFIGCDSENMPGDIASYETVILDAQYFSIEDISGLKKQGCNVFSYLNVGSVENYRDYYETFKGSTLSTYENWEDEYWMDLSDATWQSFVSETLATELTNKGIDGFFIDNADVYYMYKNNATYNGLNTVMEKLGEYKLPIIINGGDEYVTKLISDGKSNLINAVNQECVFSNIEDYDKNLFSRNDGDTTKYFTDYLKSCKDAGLNVSLTEYTKDDELASEIRKYCDENGYICYISDSVNLDG